MNDRLQIAKNRKRNGFMEVRKDWIDAREEISLRDVDFCPSARSEFLKVRSLSFSRDGIVGSRKQHFRNLVAIAAGRGNFRKRTRPPPKRLRRHRHRSQRVRVLPEDRLQQPFFGLRQDGREEHSFHQPTLRVSETSVVLKMLFKKLFMKNLIKFYSMFSWSLFFYFFKRIIRIPQSCWALGNIETFFSQNFNLDRILRFFVTKSFTLVLAISRK